MRRKVDRQDCIGRPLLPDSPIRIERGGCDDLTGDWIAAPSINALKFVQSEENLEGPC